MKRRTILLAALGLVVVAVLVMWIRHLRSAREPEKALTVRFIGYTNDSRGVRAAMLVISNQTSRRIAYEIYPPQRFGSNGWPQELPILGFPGRGGELAPHASTNRLASHVEGSPSPVRIPIHFRSSPDWVDWAEQRIRTAIQGRSLKSLFQKQYFYVHSISPEDFVFSDELPADVADELTGSDDSREQPGIASP